MTLQQVRAILTNKLTTLHAQRGYAMAIGDLDRVAAIDAEIQETQTTLDQLNAI